MREGNPKEAILKGNGPFSSMVQSYNNVRLGILPLQEKVFDISPGLWLPNSPWLEPWVGLHMPASPEPCVLWDSLAWAQGPDFHSIPLLYFTLRLVQLCMVLFQLLKSEYSDSLTYFLLRSSQRNENFDYWFLLRETSLSKSEHIWS